MPDDRASSEALGRAQAKGWPSRPAWSAWAGLCRGAPRGRASGRHSCPAPKSSAAWPSIENSLDAHRLHAQIWFWSWLTVNAGSTVGLSIAAATAGNAERVNMIGNAALAAAGVGDMLLFRPVNARFGAAPIRALPDATRAQRLRRLEAGENLMRHNAERAEQRYDWTVHAGNFAANALVGGLTWAAGDAQSSVITIVLQTPVRGVLHLDRSERPGQGLAGVSAAQGGWFARGGARLVARGIPGRRRAQVSLLSAGAGMVVPGGPPSPMISW
jgi:hypothetical protein